MEAEDMEAEDMEAEDMEAEDMEEEDMEEANTVDGDAGTAAVHGLYDDAVASGSGGDVPAPPGGVAAPEARGVTVAAPEARGVTEGGRHGGEEALTAASLWGYPLTDLGNARRLVRAFGPDIRHLHAAKAWLVWDGRRWAKDDTGGVQRHARRVVDALGAGSAQGGRPGSGADGRTERPRGGPDAEGLGPGSDTPGPGGADPDGLAGERAEAGAEAARRRVSAARRDFARRSQSRARLEAMVALAECEPGVPVRPADLDADPWLLCARNGVVDLTTGALRPHRRGDLITRLAPVDYDPDAPCPLWEATLARLLPDPAVRGFLRRSAGYALTGDVREQCVFLWHGAGRNGKTTVLEAMRRVMGDYALETPAETLTARAGGGGVPSDVARLAGARLVTARETGAGERLAEAVVKQLSGGDTVAARYLFHEWFEFRPALKLFLATNHRPRVSGTDEGVWRRIHLVPFGQTLSEAELDRGLAGRLAGEGAGILAWAVRGCLEWRARGLVPPPAVAAATAAYRRESDAVGRFLGERCALDAGLSQPAGPLQAAFATWARDEGAAVGPQEFSRRLSELGLGKVRRGSGLVWEGLALRETEDL